MPTRRSYLAALCSGSVLVAGCSGADDDDEPEPPDPGPDDDSESPAAEEAPADGEPGVSEDDGIDIRDFGAEVDGATDDTAAIQEAVDSASAGETIVFPAGTTVVSTDQTPDRSAIRLNSDELPPELTIQGQGRQSTIMLGDDQNQGGAIIRLSGISSFDGLELSGFRVDGNKDNQSEDGGHGIRVDSSNDDFVPATVTLRRLWIEDCAQTGISLWRGGTTVDHVTVWGCTKHGISVGETRERSEEIPIVMISRSLLEQNGMGGSGNTYGINCSGGNVLVSECVARNNAQGTKTTDDSITTTYHRVRLENNDHFGYIRAGADVRTRSRVTFSEVVARNNGRAGFRLSRDTDYVVPTEILASDNDENNIVITNNASLDANTVWSNYANNSYGLVSNTEVEGEIHDYYSYGNDSGPYDINEQVRLINTDQRNKDDIGTVPRAYQVGADAPPVLQRTVPGFVN